MKAINGEELKRQLDAGGDLVVVEALPEDYYRAGHIPGAGHLPLENIDRSGWLGDSGALGCGGRVLCERGV